MQRVSPASNTAGFEYTFVNKNQEHQLLKAPQRWQRRLGTDFLLLNWIAENIKTPTGFNNFFCIFWFSPQGICKKHTIRDNISLQDQLLFT